jgi:hypothetical protein
MSDPARLLDGASACRSDPSDLTTNSRAPGALTAARWNATRCPSGDQAGSESALSPTVLSCSGHRVDVSLSIHLAHVGDMGRPRSARLIDELGACGCRQSKGRCYPGDHDHAESECVLEAHSFHLPLVWLHPTLVVKSGRRIGGGVSDIASAIFRRPSRTRAHEPRTGGGLSRTSPAVRGGTGRVADSTPVGGAIL